MKWRSVVDGPLRRAMHPPRDMELIILAPLVAMQHGLASGRTKLLPAGDVWTLIYSTCRSVGPKAFTVMYVAAR